MDLRKWCIIPVIAINSLLLINGCGTVDTADGDEPEKEIILPMSSALKVSDIDIGYDGVDTYIQSRYGVTYTPDSIVTIEYCQPTGIFTTLSTERVNENGKFHYEYRGHLVNDGINAVALTIQEPGKVEYGPVWIRDISF